MRMAQRMDMRVQNRALFGLGATRCQPDRPGAQPFGKVFALGLVAGQRFGFLLDPARKLDGKRASAQGAQCGKAARIPRKDAGKAAQDRPDHAPAPEGCALGPRVGIGQNQWHSALVRLGDQGGGQVQPDEQTGIRPPVIQKGANGGKLLGRAGFGQDIDTGIGCGACPMGDEKCHIGPLARKKPQDLTQAFGLRRAARMQPQHVTWRTRWPFRRGRQGLATPGQKKIEPQRQRTCHACPQFPSSSVGPDA